MTHSSCGKLLLLSKVQHRSCCWTPYTVIQKSASAFLHNCVKPLLRNLSEEFSRHVQELCSTMNSVDINFSEFGPPIKLIIIDPKKYKSRFKKPAPAKSGRNQQYSAFERPKSSQHHQVPNNIPRSVQPQPRPQNSTTDQPPQIDVLRVPVSDLFSTAPSTNSVDTTTLNDSQTHNSLSRTPENAADQPVFIEYEDIIEEEDEQLQSFLTTEQTTRAGRVSKKTKLFSANAPPNTSNGPAADTSAAGEGTNATPPKPKVKKRKAAEAFRCKTCSKYYVGHTKLRLHYKKNPDHKIPAQQKTADAGSSISASSSVNSNSTQSSKWSKEPTSENSSEDVVILKACTSVGVQANLQLQQHPRERGSPSPTPSTSTSTLLLLNQHQHDQLQLPSSVTHPLTLEIDSDSDSTRRRMLEPITVPMTSGNVMSPGENSMNAAMTTLTMSMPMSEELQFPCSKLVESAMAKGKEGLNSLKSEEIKETDVSAGDELPIAGISGISDPSTEESPSIQQTEAPRSLGKPIWEFVEEKLTREGINQVLTEISDVAEKLSKIARDKIIPIREEEEERLQSSVPIIQVDNPFLSHLLDLPFGTYIFKDDDEDEDGPRRRPGGGLPPPPSITELSQFSLTGGAEVDIDKFLTPDSVARPLPHLTNLDFNAICSNGNSNH